MADLALHGLTKTFGKTKVLHGIDLAVQDGEFVVFVGPSGCGKSTTLRIIAGLEDATAGTVEIGGRVVNNLEPKDRDIAMVFQNYALYPHMTVRKNIGFGLRTSRLSRAEKAARIAEVAGVLGMTDLLDRRPSQLSGGQRQRVAIGRAMVRDPKVFLFDEPLSNLDAQLRTQMRLEIKKLHKQVGTTIIFVTHDQVEAMTLADRIVIMKDGVIQQVGTPSEVFNAPANVFVARFIGAPAMNLLPGSWREGGVALDMGGQIALPGRQLADGTRVDLGIRPTDLAISADGAGQITGAITLVEPLGAESMLYIDAGGVEIIAACPGRTAPDPGQQIRLSADPEALHLFDATTGEALR
ncbi:MAG: sn-glycerol-3-phosphate ABC transporter ATP-binding protein UgpC [Limimaricola sp.]|uniref:ABC transporter ATP-binding protein n=1 Tax=Limimaricola sp. TaxID=2211665 RepID=UPI001D2A7F5D|nr:sn-glycerol-3-phosphate ABC transporter ATP-binding protein UgpC [Limimaricola sp.]MBI1416749.1 sn-glycerol-3-phosphate ABC transporter ATP-binding protein UgpC [Limimaricola sp.]